MNSPLMKTLHQKIVSTLIMLSACCIPLATNAIAAKAQQKTYASPQKAAEDLIQAAKKDDISALLEIFGPDGKDFISTGDDVQDKNARVQFSKLAQQKMRVEVDPRNHNRATLVLGNEDWPAPVPIIKQGGSWRFDSKAGREEILNRRIGQNELDAIAICRLYDDAQKEYASQKHDGSKVNQYAQRLISSRGKQDGLSWKNADGTQGGPLADVVAKALQEGYTSKSGPYHGYYFKVLKGQGPAAPLGQLDYVVEGAMIGGFALIAWPAEYQSTGVKTFMVSYDGIVLEKDLGPDTVKTAASIERYNPDKTWHRTDDAL